MGKKERVMIACVTTETFRISEAAKFYDVDRIHLIHYVDENNSKKWFFQSFYDQTVKLIKESLPMIPDDVTFISANVRENKDCIDTVLEVKFSKAESAAERQMKRNIVFGSFIKILLLH